MKQMNNWNMLHKLLGKEKQEYEGSYCVQSYIDECKSVNQVDDVQVVENWDTKGFGGVSCCLAENDDPIIFI